MSEEIAPEETTPDVDPAMEATPTDEGQSEPGNESENNESFGEDSDVENTESTEQQPSDADSSGSFDVSALPEIESNYADENLNELIRRALTPIDDQNPCGENEDDAASVVSQIETATDSIHDSLRADFADAVRDQNTVTFEIASSGRDASDLTEQIIDCLETKCKSAILASYLPHLMLIEFGLPGFSAGLDIFRELIERYDGVLFPRDQERLKNYLRRGVYVGNDDKVTDNFKLFLYQPITEHNKLPYALLRNARVRGANTEIEGRYASDAAASSATFYVTLIGDLEHLIESARQANQTLNAKLNDPLFEIVSFSFVESIERMMNIVTNLATEHCSGYPPVEAEAEAVAEGAAPGAVQAATTGEIVNRDQAIEMLRRIAEFFHRTERHSPVSYRIRETIRWCQMDLPELLKELLSDDQGPLDELGKRVGFRSHESDDSEYDG